MSLRHSVAKILHKNDPHLNKILKDSDQKISTLANFQLFSSHLVCIDGPVGKGALKFATQIWPLLNCYFAELCLYMTQISSS